MKHKFFFTLVILLLLSFPSFAQDAPPKEAGNFRKPVLVELIKLDSTFKLDIRYATSSNFTGRPVYTEARAFLQRPAAESLVRVSKKLKDKGYGLMIFDGYRPWNVTKLFWDITPQDKKKFVADPAKGSRHNRGCAVDLTLYDLKTGMEVTMTGYYDEMSERSHPDYKGGTIEQRAARDLLRSMMESEGFTVYEEEWWHFDYKDWKEYPILNLKFSEIFTNKNKSIETIPTVSYCELIANPNNYSNKTVRVRATYRFGFEWSELYCSDCLKTGLTWIDFEDELCPKSKKIKGNGDAGRTVNIVAIGKFYTGGGFGHMGGYRSKFVVSCIEEAKTILNDSPISQMLPEKVRAKTYCNNERK